MLPSGRKDTTSVESPVAELGREECTLQAAAYFETCRAQLETLIEYEPEGQDGWRCIFGDGDRYTPSQLLWFERCEPASPAACE